LPDGKRNTRIQNGGITPEIKRDRLRGRAIIPKVKDLPLMRETNLRTRICDGNDFVPRSTNIDYQNQNL